MPAARKSTAKKKWLAPSPERVGDILSRLASFYGLPEPDPHNAPLDELVLTVLSQNTNDRNRDVAYTRLIERFADWQAVRESPVEEVEAAIAPGGISKVKSARIRAMLNQIANDNDGSLDLAWLNDVPLSQARSYLCSIQGVGRKTAACVLLFSFGLPDVPVDTHVSRVGVRLGLFRPAASFEAMHDAALELAPLGREYEFHVNLIRHGRRLCHARKPECRICPLQDVCPVGPRYIADLTAAD